MVRLLGVFALMASAAIGNASAFQGKTPQVSQEQSAEDHAAWVAESLKRMLTIKPGMTREALLKVFTTEGGVFNALHRTFVSRDCRFFKVRVEFQAVGRPGRDRDGRVTSVEDSRDIILKISGPYLQFTIAD